VEHPSHVLEIGQEVEVMVLNINHERRQVALSTKRLEADPWTTVSERYEEGQLVEGRITRLTKWGAFARLVDDEAIEGLIHISELDAERVVHPRDVVKPGQSVTLRIVRMEPERRRLGLSIKQVADGEQADGDWKADYAASAQPPMDSPMASAFDEAVKG
jgi:small subunit ribosomal protein S1